MYNVRLTQFEGPFDLLLFFIKRDELDIYDIPISKITKEFLEYLNEMRELDLEIAGDFIVMASTLMQIKTRMLLPRPVLIEGEEEEEDPRAELVKRLLEYRRFKEVAEEFSMMSEAERGVYFREFFKEDTREAPADEDLRILKNITLFDLMSAYKRALDKAPKPVTTHDIKKIPVTIEERSEHILSTLAARRQVTFTELIMDVLDEKIAVVVTFIAILELVKSAMIAARQDDNFQDILLYQI